jgi:glycosyltransferase involved in cell wall biosynthesis
MKIGVFSDQFYPELSGIADSVLILGTELAKRGHDVFYIAPQYSIKDYKKADRLINGKKDNTILENHAQTLRLFSIPYPGSPTGQSRIVLAFLPTIFFLLPFFSPLLFFISSLFSFFSCSSISKIKKMNIDIVHTHSPFGVGFEAIFISKLLKIPLVGTNHTPVEEFIRYAPIKGKSLEKLARKFYSWYYNHCLFVSSPSDELLKNMEEVGFKKPHLQISNPIEIDDYHPVSPQEKADLKKKYSLKSNVILYTGRIAVEKNIDVIIRALKIVVARFPDTTLVITGHGAAKKSLENLVAELDLKNNVLFTGFTKKEDFIRYYQTADIFTIMSTAETQSLSLMQAMATQLPTIVANSGGLAEYTKLHEEIAVAKGFAERGPEEDANRKSHRGFVVEPDDYKTVAEKIILLLRNPELRETMGKAGKEFAQGFKASAIAEQWEKIYKNAIVSA